MTIKLGENPQHTWDCNKFICKDGDGMRGTIVAIRKDRRQAIILATNGGMWGRFLLIQEEDSGRGPREVKQVFRIRMAMIGRSSLMLR